jgi:hypothetical protein
VCRIRHTIQGCSPNLSAELEDPEPLKLIKDIETYGKMWKQYEQIWKNMNKYGKYEELWKWDGNEMEIVSCHEMSGPATAALPRGSMWSYTGLAARKDSV